MSEQNRVSPDSIRNLAAQTAESRRGRIAFLRVASRVFLGDAGLCVARPLPTPPAVPGDAGSLIHTSRPCLALRLYLRGGRGVLPGASPCPAGHPGAMTQAESPQALRRPEPRRPAPLILRPALGPCSSSSRAVSLHPTRLSLCPCSGRGHHRSVRSFSCLPPGVRRETPLLAPSLPLPPSVPM